MALPGTVICINYMFSLVCLLVPNIVAILRPTEPSVIGPSGTKERQHRFSVMTIVKIDAFCQIKIVK